jgi:hypothetical protein
MRSFARCLALVTGAACLLPSCSQRTSGLKHLGDAGAGGQTEVSAGGGAGGGPVGTIGTGGITASGGATGGASGTGATGPGGGGGGPRVDAPSLGGTDGGPIPDAAVGSDGRTGGAIGTGGVGIGSGGTLPLGGAGGSAGIASGFGGSTGTGGIGATTTCPRAPSCNWCNGDPLRDSAGCVTGYRCANGEDPCMNGPECTSDSSCPSGKTCRNLICMPAGGAGGGSATGGTGGAAGASGTGGAGGTTGTGPSGIRCGNAVCSAGLQVCCVSLSSAALDCTPPAECTNMGGLAVSCDGPEDCGAGQHCCMPSGALMQTTCTSGSCLAGLAMCHSSADCAPAETCCSITLSNYTYGTCATGACPP